MGKGQLRSGVKAAPSWSSLSGAPALALAMAYNLDLSLDFRINIDHVEEAPRPDLLRSRFFVLADA